MGDGPRRGALDIGSVRARGGELVTAVYLDAFVGMGVNELHRLHEGNIARFGLHLSEFREWRRMAQR
jgi:hypothetical protein